MARNSSEEGFDDRAGRNFGQLLGWHFLRGTRPGGKRDHPGRRWGTKTFADAVGVSDRTVRYWLKNQHLPPEIETIERLLFGNDATYDDWRLELRRAHAKGWETNDSTIAAPKAVGELQADKAVRISNIPIRVPTHFMGRDGALSAIDAALVASHSSGSAIAALHGLRGVGKSTLAAAYAERRCSQYAATWWIRAHAEPTLRADLVALGVRLGWVGANQKERPALAVVMERLSSGSNPILLIYDNAISASALEQYLPRAGANPVLITSNAHAWRGVAQPIEIKVWPKEIGADYLIARTGRASERENAEALSQALGGLALAPEQAAAYCERLEIPLTEYLQRFRSAPGRLLDVTRDAPSDYYDRRTVAKTFALAIDEAGKLHAAAEPLIMHAALLAPDPIPLFLLAEGREKLGEPLAAALADEGLEEAIATLRSFALLDRESIADERDPKIVTETIRVHRLVREVAAARPTPPWGEQARCSLVRAMATIFPKDVFDDPLTWPRARRLVEHARVLLTSYDAPPAGAEDATADLADRAGSYLHAALAAYERAVRPFKEALAIREKVLGPEHPLTAASLNNLARVLWDAGDLNQAQSLFERALAIRETILGPEDPKTAASLQNLGGLLQSRGDLTAAKPLFERALAIHEKILGPEHHRTAGSLNNLARLLRDRSEFDAALPIAERALVIREHVFGPEHPRTAASLNNVGRILHGQGDYARARVLFERALAICEKILGSDHPYTAATLANLARLFHALGDVARARPLFERSLAIREKVAGPTHPSTASSLSGLADVLRDQGDVEGARPLYERALAIREEIFGSNDSLALMIRNSLSELRSRGQSA
jgi:tetratricopeptide (TPR) repeat protein